ncbi:MAG: sigma 54-interacting transcriptional regulator [Proteobacteria bacterium]|nr:sigma 54-interacting transcriptional regulator [Pseudomonadota bacterium]
MRVLFEANKGIVDRPARYMEVGQEVVIGRGVRDGGLDLADRRASRRHAVLRARPGTVDITDTSSNGTFVNGKRVQSAVLADGDIIRVGDSFMLLRYVPSGITDVHIGGMVGKAPSMCSLRHTIATVATTDATVLILGESGTGKELVSRALHSLSKRPGPFVAVNCSAIPESLAESQFFGHVAGSFTGATSDRGGFFRDANQGTLFLDEIGEMPHKLQPKLLRVLEERTVTPVGATRSELVDVRVVAATNLNLQNAVDGGKFRGDLYARVAELTIHTPPLRNRREDILLILASALGPDAPKLSPQLVASLLLHPWRFNVRELIKVAKQLRIYGATSDQLELAMVENRLRQPTADPVESGTTPAPKVPPSRRARSTGVQEIVLSRDELVNLVIEAKGNISELSRKLGRSRRQIYRYLDKYGIDLDQYR